MPQVEIEDAVLREIVRRIAAAADPDRIILFGSRARGGHRPGSDSDRLVIRETGERKLSRAVPAHQALRHQLLAPEARP